MSLDLGRAHFELAQVNFNMAGVSVQCDVPTGQPNIHRCGLRWVPSDVGLAYYLVPAQVNVNKAGVSLQFNVIDVDLVGYTQMDFV